MSLTCVSKSEWRQFGLPEEFDAWLTPEAEGGYSVVAVGFPGICSQGEFVQDAIANITDAFKLVFECAGPEGVEVVTREIRPPGVLEVTIALAGKDAAE